MIKHMGTDAFRVTLEAPMTRCMAEYGPRFDTLGAITSVRLGDLEFCAREGLIDEFNIHDRHSPPGYESAPPGGSFLKIGVGELVRPDGKHYVFHRPYAHKNIAPARVSVDGNEASLSQACKSNGWAYEYRKTYRVAPRARRLDIIYSLKNTGREPFAAEQYNHNWFNIGRGAIDHSFLLEHSFPISGQHPGWFRTLDGNLAIVEEITKPVYHPSDTPAPAADNRMVLKHAASGGAVTATGDFDMARFALYAERQAICPEVFMRTELEPGASAEWSRNYAFAN